MDTIFKLTFMSEKGLITSFCIRVLGSNYGISLLTEYCMDSKLLIEEPLNVLLTIATLFGVRVFATLFFIMG